MDVLELIKQLEQVHDEYGNIKITVAFKFNDDDDLFNFGWYKYENEDIYITKKTDSLHENGFEKNAKVKILLATGTKW